MLVRGKRPAVDLENTLRASRRRPEYPSPNERRFVHAVYYLGRYSVFGLARPRLKSRRFT
jgi:hypothetical protein